jgi:hypothetical protein
MSSLFWLQLKFHKTEGPFDSTYFICFCLTKVEAESKGPTQNSFFKAKQIFHSTKFTAGYPL